MRFTYSEGADALYVELATDRPSVRTQEIVPGVIADLDEAGRVLGLEVLNASHRYPRPELEALEKPVDWLTLAEAAGVAAELGEPLKPTTLRSQVAKGKLQAEKRGRDLVVARHELLNYLGRRSPQGRRAGGKPRRETIVLGRVAAIRKNDALHGITTDAELPPTLKPQPPAKRPKRAHPRKRGAGR
jgi:uncharacterized protein YuzE